MGDSLNGLQAGFGLSLTTDVDDSGTPIVDGSDEKICKSFSNVTLIASDGSQASRNLGAGAAFVTTRRLVWVKSGHHREGYVAHFRQIIVHAISRDGGDTGAPCVFVQLEEPSEYDDREGEETGTSPVLYMVPAQAEDVGPMYDAMCESALLNPDPVEEDEGEFFFNEDEVAAGAAASLSQLDNAIHMPSAEDFDELVGDDPGRFEDDEDEDDTPN